MRVYQGVKEVDTYDIAMEISETLDRLYDLKGHLYYSQDEAINRAYRMIEKLDTLYQELWRQDPRIPAKSWVLHGSTEIWRDLA